VVGALIDPRFTTGHATAYSRLMSAGRHLLLRGALCLAPLLCARWAQACPDCALGRQVRERFLGDGFWPALAAVALPVVVVAAMSARLYRIGKGEVTWKSEDTKVS
jgi:hypothetical protein